jgi:hypothetical protein
MFAEPDGNRRASDYLQEDQRDSQTDLPLFLLLLTVSSRRMCKVARTGSQHQGALFGGFTWVSNGARQLLVSLLNPARSSSGCF